MRVLRGGSYNNNPDNLRSSHRNNNDPGNHNNNNGFRLVRSGRSSGCQYMSLMQSVYGWADRLSCT
ncbi:MAG TPA: SUMF1/EgtB/PvdO family nonheme iron enzyme [Spirochaetota bacterium]|nr:SUMF1/EgtB/PvdO family nonheme iron enzyme [Spirochaetota bacterium]